MSNDVKKYLEYLLQYFTDQQNNCIDIQARPLQFNELYGYELDDDNLLSLLISVYYKK